MTVGTVEIMIAFSVLLQWASGEKSRRKVSIYKYSNSFTVIGRVAFDNKYRILTLNCGSVSIVFAKASEVIVAHLFSGMLIVLWLLINEFVSCSNDM